MKVLSKIAIILIISIAGHCYCMKQGGQDQNRVFTTQELETFIAKKLKEAKKTDKKKAKKIAKQLSKFKITGVAMTTDFNLALFYDTQNPDLHIRYKNNKNKIKTRKYKSSISSLGIKAELDFRILFIFITDTDFNFYNSDELIELGKGIDLRTGCFDFTYAKFANRSGGVMFVGLPTLGVLATILSGGLAFFNLGVSIVTGGFLVPVPQFKNSKKYQKS